MSGNGKHKEAEKEGKKNRKRRRQWGREGQAGRWKVLEGDGGGVGGWRGVFMFECQRRGGDPFLKGSFGGGGADGTDAGELLLAGRQADGTKRLQIAAIRPSRKSEYQSDRPPPPPPRTTFLPREIIHGPHLSKYTKKPF